MINREGGDAILVQNGNRRGGWSRCVGEVEEEYCKHTKSMNVRMSPGWKELLSEEFGKPYFKDLTEFVHKEYRTTRVFPSGKDIFKAFDKCPLEALKVVLIGQDPYHGEGQANGLCFSVADGVEFPPSLRNIFTEIESDIGTPIPQSGDLDRWAEQGVLLLNAVLTVRSGSAASHRGVGWERFTDAVVRGIAERKEGVVYLLWGNYAQQKASFVDQKRNYILRTVHPSPLSAYRGFFGCKHFSKTNEYLVERGEEPIIW